MILWLAIPVAYLLGSVPFGLIIGRAHGIDIREHGSKNIGATNVRRVLGSKAGNLCLALDMLKGAAPVLGAGWLAGLLARPIATPGQATAWFAVAVFGVIGHMFPIYLRFKGGKGVATGFGAILGLWPVGTLAALAALGVWIAVARATRYVSVASCAAAVALPVVALAAGAASLSWLPPLALVWPMVAGFAAIAALVVFKHRSNLARVRAGSEPKIGQRQAPPEGAADRTADAR
jgi:glycerol-3-phosphate acyltransferase PlsY